MSQEFLNQNDFEKNVQEWVILDNQLKAIAEKTKQLREKRQALGEKILKRVDERRINSIDISDGRLKFVHTKIAQPLTFQYLQKSLKEMIPQDDKVTKMMDYIKANREMRTIQEIKRFP